MIPLFFFKDIYPGKTVLRLNTILWKIVALSPAELIPSFSFSKNLPFPRIVGNLWNHIPGAGSSAPFTGKKLPLHVRHMYPAPEV
jgi:hypothetical protein